MNNRVDSSATIAKIKILQQPTNSAWIELAIANLNTILLDHSHCERKAEWQLI